MSKINWNFNNTYFNLSKSFKEDINPIPVKKPELILLNSTKSGFFTGTGFISSLKDPGKLK